MPAAISNARRPARENSEAGDGRRRSAAARSETPGALPHRGEHRHRPRTTQRRCAAAGKRGRRADRLHAARWHRHTEIETELTLKRAVVTLMLLAAPLSVRAQTKLTLQEALNRALQVNNTVERSRVEVNVAEQNRKQLLSSILPQVNLTGSTIENSKEVAFGSGADARTILPATDWNYRVVLSQPIYAGMREKRAYDQAKIGITNARQGVLGTEDAVLLRVASNYLGVANADANIAIERRNIELAEKRKTQSTAFYQAGEVTKVDVLRAETAIKAAQRLLAAAQDQREAAESALRADLDVTGDIAVASPDPSLAPIPDEQTLDSKAEAVRPDVAIAEQHSRGGAGSPEAARRVFSGCDV